MEGNHLKMSLVCEQKVFLIPLFYCIDAPALKKYIRKKAKYLGIFVSSYCSIYWQTSFRFFTNYSFLTNKQHNSLFYMDRYWFKYDMVPIPQWFITGDSWMDAIACRFRGGDSAITVWHTPFSPQSISNPCTFRFCELDGISFGKVGVVWIIFRSEGFSINAWNEIPIKGEENRSEETGGCWNCCWFEGGIGMEYTILSIPSHHFHSLFNSHHIPAGGVEVGELCKSALLLFEYTLSIALELSLPRVEESHPL